MSIFYLFQMMASPFSNRHPCFAQRALFRFISRNGKMKERIYFFRRHAKVRLAAGTVNEQTDSHDIALSLIDYIHHFFDGTAGGDDIFHNQHFFAGSDFKAAAARAAG